MTLLIGTVARASLDKSHLTLTADGRSTLIDGLARTVTNDAYQKIFPVPNLPIAIVHHGENVIAEKPVRQFLENFIGRSFSTSSTPIDRIATSLKEYAETEVEATLRTGASTNVGSH